MGIGNLQDVLDDYDGGRAVPYAQLYFDTAPDHHTSAYDLISGFGDDSSLYYWRVLGAQQIMRLYRTDRAALTRLSSLQTAVDSQAYVLHPPDAVHPFPTPDALDDAYAQRRSCRCPRTRGRSGSPMTRASARSRRSSRSSRRCTAACARRRSTC